MQLDLKEAAQELLDRIAKFVDRRVDDGPDWEFSKLHRAMEKVKNAIEGETNG